MTGQRLRPAADTSAPVNKAPDAPVNTAPDAPVNTAPDALVNTAGEAPVNSAPEAHVSTAPEAPANTAPEAPANTAPEAPANTAPEAPVNTAPRRINADRDQVERGLVTLVLTLVELLRQLMERQALRRVEDGTLDDDKVEEIGQTLQALDERMSEITEQFGLTRADLNLDLGPLGQLLPQQ